MNSLFLKVSVSKYVLDSSQFWFGFCFVFQNIIVGCNSEYEFSSITDYIPICNIHISKNEGSISVYWNFFYTSKRIILTERPQVPYKVGNLG